ncbi:MAG: pyridoxamine kinase [Ruminococcus sp.]|nr:pyridoxamine kinase [Ruminococcus sp.]
MKRILTIQDISCVGKCSLTVALPIISATGVETAILPTAVLSTHTMFQNFTCKDLDDQILPIAKHWKDENITFDAFYTGYLASAQQIDKVLKLINSLKREADLVIVDPAMADNGKLYPAFDSGFPKEMARLAAQADIVLPNITEACLMTNTPYRESYDEQFAKEVVKKLAAQGVLTVVLTGAAFDGKYGVLIYDSKTEEFRFYAQNKVDASYHGTGDVFSSAFTGLLLRGKSVLDSVKIAADFTAESIRLTKETPGSNWYGVDFERVLPYLIERIDAK